MLKILHDPKYLKHWEIKYHSRLSTGRAHACKLLGGQVGVGAYEPMLVLSGADSGLFRMRRSC